MKLSTSTVLLGSGLLVAASPQQKCAAVTKLVTSLRGASSATAFCSSFLKIPVVTKTTTSTITPRSAIVTASETATLPDVFTTTTITESETTTVTSTTDTQVTVVSTSYSTTFSPTAISCATAAGQLEGLQPRTLTDSSNDKRGNKQPAPTPNCVKNQDKNKISSACSCLGVKTSTTTKTVKTTLPVATITTTQTATLSPVITNTDTATSTFTETSTEANTLEPTTSTTVITVIQPTPDVFGGLRYYESNNNYDFNQANPGEDISQYRGVQSRALSSGLIQNLNVINSQGTNFCVLPGKSAPQDCRQLTLVMQGFLFARETGTYALSIGRNGEPSSGNTVDNYFGVWSDEAAYQFTNSNSDFTARRVGLGSQFRQENGRSTYELTSGEVQPITAIYMNGGGSASYQFYLYPPGQGEVTDTSSYFIPACDQGNPFVSSS